MKQTKWQQNYEVYKKYLRNVATLYKSRQDLKMFTELLLSMATVITFGLFAIKPTLVTIAKLYRQMTEKEETIKTMDQKISNLVKAKELYDSQTQSINLLNEAVPTEPEVHKFVRQIEGLSQKNGVNLIEFSISDATIIGRKDTQEELDDNLVIIPEDAQNIPVIIGATGDYSSLFSFISDLQILKRPVFFDISLVSISNEETAFSLTANITGRIVYINKNE